MVRILLKFAKLFEAKYKLGSYQGDQKTFEAWQESLYNEEDPQSLDDLSEKEIERSDKENELIIGVDQLISNHTTELNSFFEEYSAETKVAKKIKMVIDFYQNYFIQFADDMEEKLIDIKNFIESNFEYYSDETNALKIRECILNVMNFYKDQYIVGSDRHCFVIMFKETTLIVNKNINIMNEKNNKEVVLVLQSYLDKLKTIKDTIISLCQKDLHFAAKILPKQKVKENADEPKRKRNVVDDEMSEELKNISTTPPEEEDQDRFSRLRS